MDYRDRIGQSSAASRLILVGELICLGAAVAGLLLLMVWAARPSWFREIDARAARRFFASPEASSFCPEGLLVAGGPETGLSLSQKRADLGADLDLLRNAGPRVVILEDWLDESSQAETQALLGSIRQDFESATGKLPAKGRKLGHVFESLLQRAQDQLQADRNLADDFDKDPSLVLPLQAVPAKERNSQKDFHLGFQVILKGKGQQNLAQEYRLARQPLERFLEVAKGTAAVEGEPGEAYPRSTREIPLLFQINGQWVPSAGLEAALRVWGLTRSAMRFIWKKDQGALCAVEMKGQRFPLTPQGSVWLPENEAPPKMEKIPLAALKADATARAKLKGRAVFFRPWPQALSDTGGFDRQHDVFACLSAGKLVEKPADESVSLAGLALWAAGVALLLLMPWRFAFLAPWPVLGALAVALRDSKFSASATLGLCLSAMLVSFGWKGRGFFVKRWERALCFRDVLAPSAWPAWAFLLKASKGGVNFGAYVAVEGDWIKTPARLEAWAARHRAFADEMKNGKCGFFVPYAREKEAPLDAAWELNNILNGAKLALSQGSMDFTPRGWMRGILWNLEGQPKAQAQKMLRHAKPGGVLVTENVYAIVKGNVQVQMLEAVELPGMDKPARLFNVVNRLYSGAIQ